MPGPDPSKETEEDPGLLGRMNNLLTAVAAIVATIGTIVGTIAANLASGAKEEAKDAKGQTSELRQTVEDIARKREVMADTYKYVDYFLKYQMRKAGENASPGKEAEGGGEAGKPAEGGEGSLTGNQE